jgi:hypothetical protein
MSEYTELKKQIASLKEQNEKILGQLNRLVEPHKSNPDSDSGKLYMRDQIDYIWEKAGGKLAK